MSFKPELGQLAFGQPWQEYKVSAELECALAALSNAWSVLRSDTNPFDNSGDRYDGKAFKVHAYSWNDDEQRPFNFEWRDVRVSWYKYFGRGMSANQGVSTRKARALLHECMTELLATQGAPE